MIGEFEDYAMLREFARGGHGFAPVPSVLEDQFRRQYGFAKVGLAHGVKAEFYAISVERKVKHPAIAALTDNARRIFAAHSPRKSPAALFRTVASFPAAKGATFAACLCVTAQVRHAPRRSD